MILQNKTRYLSRDGTTVQINFLGQHQAYGQVFLRNGGWFTDKWTLEGRYLGEQDDQLDLITELPQSHPSSAG